VLIVNEQQFGPLAPAFGTAHAASGEPDTIDNGANAAQVGGRLPTALRSSHHACHPDEAAGPVR
jgi:hypothetical protein